MTRQITANLPSRDFDITQAFYQRLGFETVYRGEGWMILSLEGMWVEFFLHPELDPMTSWFSACFRAPEIDPIHEDWSKLGLSSEAPDLPRLGKEAFTQEGVPRMFVLHDPDGSLWRVLEMGADW